MQSKDIKNDRVAVWFNPDQLKLFNSLNLSISLSKFVHNAFHDSVDKKRLEVIK